MGTAYASSVRLPLEGYRARVKAAAAARGGLRTRAEEAPRTVRGRTPSPIGRRRFRPRGAAFGSSLCAPPVRAARFSERAACTLARGYDERTHTRLRRVRHPARMHYPLRRQQRASPHQGRRNCDERQAHNRPPPRPRATLRTGSYCSERVRRRPLAASAPNSGKNFNLWAHKLKFLSRAGPPRAPLRRDSKGALEETAGQSRAAVADSPQRLRALPRRAPHKLKFLPKSGARTVMRRAGCGQSAGQDGGLRGVRRKRDARRAQAACARVATTALVGRAAGLGGGPRGVRHKRGVRAGANSLRVRQAFDAWPEHFTPAGKKALAAFFGFDQTEGRFRIANPAFRPSAGRNVRF